MLVSAIMPTADRHEFIPRAIRNFQSQVYKGFDLELVIYDDGFKSVQDLIPTDDPRIRYIRWDSGRFNHGKKMQKLVQHYAEGELCIVWDDDDVYAPNRVQRQIEPLLASYRVGSFDGKIVSGTSSLFYYLHKIPEAWKYEYPTTPAQWLGALAFRRDWALAHPFKDSLFGADLSFLQGIPKDQWVDLRDPSLLVCAIHQNNAAPKPRDGVYMKKVDFKLLPEYFLKAVHMDWYVEAKP